MAIKIRNAVLHILHNNGPSSVFSDRELDYDSESCFAFIAKHVKKLINNASVRTGVFKPDSVMYQLLERYKAREIHFQETALTIAERLDEFMQAERSIPPCDILITKVGQKSGEFLAVLLLHYHDVYTHKTIGSENVLQTLKALPFSSGKVEYAALFDLDGAGIGVNLIEKPIVINGTNTMFFSEMFLECDTNPSRKETAVLINEVTSEFVDEFFRGDPKVNVKIKTALVGESESEDGYVSMDNVASAAFSDHEDAKVKYVNTLRDAGLQEDVVLGQNVVKQQFSTHKIKAENGVEIRFPAELADSEEGVEITTHPDGTVSVLLKNLRMV